MEDIIEEKYFSDCGKKEELPLEELEDEENFKYFEGTVNFRKNKSSIYHSF